MALKEFGKNVWTMDGDDVRMYSIPFQTRMSIVRLADGNLWLHSPIAITTNRLKQIAQLGTVKYIVAPNIFHHLFAGDWANSFPDAELWGAPGLQKKRLDLNFAGELVESTPGAWGDEIEQLVFTGSKILREMVFFHPSSKTLILTDLIQNHDPSHDGWFWRTVKKFNAILAPNGGVPRDLRLAFRDHEAAKESLGRILEWDFSKIILGHGFCIEVDAKGHFSRAFDWLK